MPVIKGDRYPQGRPNTPTMAAKGAALCQIVNVPPCGPVLLTLSSHK
jgi:hypothetical protein